MEGNKVGIWKEWSKDTGNNPGAGRNCSFDFVPRGNIFLVVRRFFLFLQFSDV